MTYKTKDPLARVFLCALASGACVSGWVVMIYAPQLITATPQHKHDMQNQQHWDRGSQKDDVDGGHRSLLFSDDCCDRAINFWRQLYHKYQISQEEEGYIARRYTFLQDESLCNQECPPRINQHDQDKHIKIQALTPSCLFIAHTQVFHTSFDFFF